MYSTYASPPVCANETAVTAAASIAHSTNSTLTSSTWSSNSAPAHSHGGSHLGLPYSSFDPGPSTSGMYGSQGGVFPFPAYPSMHMPFEYQQVLALYSVLHSNLAYNSVSTIIFFLSDKLRNVVARSLTLLTLSNPPSSRSFKIYIFSTLLRYPSFFKSYAQ